MKKVLPFILVTVMALSLFTLGASAAATEGLTGIPMQPDVDDRTAVWPANKEAILGEQYSASYTLGDGIPGVTEFNGKSTEESTHLYISDMPKGVNGVELLKTDVRYEMDTKSYRVTINTVPNPTVQIFKDLEIILTINKNVNGSTYTARIEIPITTVMNPRHFYSDVTSAASGYRLLLATKPVIDESVFYQNTGQELHIDYSDYNILFKNISEQNTGLYLKADYSYTLAGTDKDSDQPLVSLGFENIIVKDEALIQIRFKADQQNYNGENVWVYDMVDGHPTGTGYKATISNTDNAVTITVPAGTSFSKLGIYGSEQDTSKYTSSGSGSGSSGAGGSGDSGSSIVAKNPNTGSTDVISVAIIFAVLSLAATGFIAVRKASK